MKKRLTRGEKWLFASPLLFLVIAGAAWMRQKSVPYSITVPQLHRVSALEFSPDGKRLVAFYSRVGGSEVLGQILDVSGHSKARDLQMPEFSTRNDSIGMPSWSPDGKSIVASCRLFSPTNDLQMVTPVNEILVWDTTSGLSKSKFVYPLHDVSPSLGDIRYSSDGLTLKSGGVPAVLFDARTGKRLKGFDRTINYDPFYSKLSENRQWLALNEPNKKQFRVVDFRSKRVLWKPYISYLNSFEWGGDVLCVQNDGVITRRIRQSENRLMLWNGKTRQLLPSPPIRAGAEISGFSFSPDRKTLVYFNGNNKPSANRRRTMDEWANDYDGELVAWDYVANRVLWRHKSSRLLIRPQWSPDGKKLSVHSYAQGREFCLSVFDTDGNLQFEREPISTLIRWSPDSRQLAIAVSKTGKWGATSSTRLEIHRFED